MKRLSLAFLFILFGNFGLWAQSQTTIIGTVQGATSGYVEFRLQPWSTSIQYYVQGGPIIASMTTRCGISSGGSVLSITLSGACQVWSNTLITPANTTYTVVYFPNGTQSNQVARQLITGTTYNLNSPVFAPVVNIVPQYQTLTTSPINTNLTPSATRVFNLGSSGRYYAAGYIDNLFVNNFNGPLESISVLTANNIRKCDQFPGIDGGAKIAACLADLPSTGGVADARGLEGAQSASSTITVSTPSVVLLSYGTFTSTANPVFDLTANGSSIACAAPNSSPSLFVADTGCIIATTNTTGDIIKVSARSTSITDVTLRYASAVARTGGSALKIESGSAYGTYERIKIEKTYIGINMAEGSSTGTFRDIYIHSVNAGAGGAWYEAIVLSGCTAANTPAQYGCGAGIPGTVTDTHFDNIIISVDAAYSGAAVVKIDGGTDSITFNRLAIIKSAPCDTTDCGILMLFQNSVGAVGSSFDPPRWINCTICAFEGAATNATNPVIKIQAGKSVRFINNLEVAGGTQGFLITSGTRAHEYTNVVEIASTPIALSGQESIKIVAVPGSATAPNGFQISDIYIHHNSISLPGVQMDNTYSAIHVSDDVSKFYITDNDFDPLFGGFPNKPDYYIQIDGPDNDNYVMKDNHFTAAFRGTADILDGAAGGDRITGPNNSNTNGSSNMRVNGSFTSTYGADPTSMPNFTSGNFGCGSAVLSTSCSMAWGDGSGYKFNFGHVTGGAFVPKITFYDHGKIVTATQIESQQATGTPPFIVASKTAVANLTASPLIYNEAGTQYAAPHFSATTDQLAAGTKLVTFAGSAAFADMTYSCVATSKDSNPVSYVVTAANQVTVSGTGTSIFTLLCFGL